MSAARHSLKRLWVEAIDGPSGMALLMVIALGTLALVAGIYVVVAAFTWSPWLGCVVLALGIAVAWHYVWKDIDRDVSE